MAITDKTGLSNSSPGLDFAQSGPFFYKTRIVDFTADPGLGTQFAHPLLDINVGEALMGFCIVIRTDLAGASATLTFQTGAAVALSTAIVATTLDAGMSLQLNSNIKAATGFDIVGSANTYAHTTAGTFDMDVNVADITAGKFLLYAYFLRNLDVILA